MCFLFFLEAGIFLCVLQAISAAPSAAKTTACFLLSNVFYLPRWVVRLLPIFLILVPPSVTLPPLRLFLRCLPRPIGLAGVALAQEAPRGVNQQHEGLLWWRRLQPCCPGNRGIFFSSFRLALFAVPKIKRPVS